jgi:hypothetical protein
LIGKRPQDYLDRPDEEEDEEKEMIQDRSQHLVLNGQDLDSEEVDKHEMEGSMNRERSSMGMESVGESDEEEMGEQTHAGSGINDGRSHQSTPHSPTTSIPAVTAIFLLMIPVRKQDICKERRMKWSKKRMTSRSSMWNSSMGKKMEAPCRNRNCHVHLSNHLFHLTTSSPLFQDPLQLIQLVGRLPIRP